MGVKKYTKIAALTSMLFVVVVLAAEWTPFGPNLGLHFGYYGTLNRILANLRHVEGLEITQLAVNYDMDLEEINIQVLIDREFQADVQLAQAPDATRDFFAQSHGVTVDCSCDNPLLEVPEDVIVTTAIVVGPGKGGYAECWWRANGAPLN